MTLTAKQWLENRFQGRVRFMEPMARHTSLGVGGPADAVVWPADAADVSELVQWLSRREIGFCVVGGGTNLLVSDEGIRGVVICMSRCLNRIIRSETHAGMVEITAGAGLNFQKLCRHAVSNGLSGMQFAAGIPGSVGGAVRMNAGTRIGAVEQVLRRVRVMKSDGAIRQIDRNDLVFQYRRTFFNRTKAPDAQPPIILEACFGLQPSDSETLEKEITDLLKDRRNRQPTGVRSAGCFFKNPPGGRSAGELIETAGLKGLRVGGAEVSLRHANFIVNRNHATANDVLELMKTVQDRVLRWHGILLDTEVRIIGTEAYSKKSL